MIELGGVKGVESPVSVVERILVAGDTGGKPALRGFPSMVEFEDGEFLVGYDLCRDHHVTTPMSWMITRSFDEGKTWGESFAVCSLPGYQLTGNLGLMKCPDGSIMGVMARCYWPSWRQFTSVSLELPHVRVPMKPSLEMGRRRFDVFLIRSWDKGYNWTPLGYPIDLFPGEQWGTNVTGNSGPHELSDGRWMLAVDGELANGHWVGGVTYSSDTGFTWSPVKIIYDLPYANPSEHRITRLDERRLLSHIRSDPRTRGTPWNYDDNVVHFSLSEDDGETWGRPWKSNFVGAGSPELHILNDRSFIMMYRDMDVNRPGLSVSHSVNEGRTWRFIGQLSGPSDILPMAHMEGGEEAPFAVTDTGTTPATKANLRASETRRQVELGYPVALRISNGRIFVVHYGPWRNGNADIVGVYLDDLT